MPVNQENDFDAADEVEVSIEPEEGDDGTIDIGNFTPVNFSNSNRRVIDLYRAYKEDKDIDPRPPFQRGYVWDSRKASTLVESILLNVPLPLVYTAEEDSGKEVVIDGQQRLTTCFAFIDGYFPLSKKDEERESRGEQVRRRPFRLKKLKILRKLEGMCHSDLDEETKNRFHKFTIPTIKISKDSHPDVKFEIF
jgi:hypothetical protein